MYRKHSFAGKAILPLFTALTLVAGPAFSQDYSVANNVAQSNVPDSITAPRLQVAIKPTDAGGARFRVTILNPTAHAVSITISRGHDLFFEDINGDPAYDKLFNLSDLEDGDYMILVSSGREKIAHNIHIETETKVDRQFKVD